MLCAHARCVITRDLVLLTRSLSYTVAATVIMLFCTVTDDVLHNVALNKRSYQVSTFRDQYGFHAASLANDGSRQTNYEDIVNGCARSLSATNPWWVVDLGAETLVVQVNLTNRGDDDGIYSDLHFRLTVYY